MRSGEGPRGHTRRDEARGRGAEPFRERILAHARDKLADFKVPRRIELVEALPRATLEKVNKAALRASLSERAGG